MELLLEYGILGITLLITMGSQAYIKSKYESTKKIKGKKGYQGKDVARKILDTNGLKNVKVEKVEGVLSDHYDPTKKVVRLSEEIYDQDSIAAASVAAHECGHAIQDKDSYLFLRIRHHLVPLVNFSSTIGYIAILIGVFAGWLHLVYIGIALEAVILLFQLVTLPVEFNASKRGLNQLEKLNLLEKTEMGNAKGMLTAAALTYVAATANAILQIVRLILIYGRRRDN